MKRVGSGVRFDTVPGLNDGFDVLVQAPHGFGRIIHILATRFT